MNWTRCWTLEAAGAVAGRIWFDATGGSLLVADGWGVAFAALGVRRVEPSTGRVLATVRTRTPIRAFGRAGRSLADALFLLGDKRIFVHDAATLERRAEYATRVPRYSNAICEVGEATVALAAPAALVQYDLTTSRSRRASNARAVALDVVDGRPFSVLADGVVASRTDDWKPIGGFEEACYIAHIDAASGVVAALGGVRASAYDDDGNPQPGSYGPARTRSTTGAQASAGSNTARSYPSPRKPWESSVVYSLPWTATPDAPGLHA